MTDETSTKESKPNVEYVRRLYGSVLDWYKNADSKAQVILTLDGAFLTVITAMLFENPETVNGLRWHTALFLGLMVLSLAASVYHAIACIWSRIYSADAIKEIFRDARVDISNYETYSPSICWFFQFIAELNKEEFAKRMSGVGSAFEVEAMSGEAVTLSVNVRKKHHHVNYGFVFAGVTLAIFVLSAVSFFLAQKQVL